MDTQDIVARLIDGRALQVEELTHYRNELITSHGSEIFGDYKRLKNSKEKTLCLLYHIASERLHHLVPHMVHTDPIFEKMIKESETGKLTPGKEEKYKDIIFRETQVWQVREGPWATIKRFWGISEEEKPLIEQLEKEVAKAKDSQ